jgi:hypothetical protein
VQPFFGAAELEHAAQQAQGVVAGDAEMSTWANWITCSTT